jgi:hypothetical protein
MHDIYRSIDLVAHLLQAHDRLVGSKYLGHDITSLSRPGPSSNTQT